MVNDDAEFDQGAGDNVRALNFGAQGSADPFLTENTDSDDGLEDAANTHPAQRWNRRSRLTKFWFQVGALLFLGCFLIGWPAGTTWAEYEQTGIFNFRLGFTLPVFMYMVTIPILIYLIGNMLAIGFKMASKAEELEESAKQLLQPDVIAAEEVETVGTAVNSQIDTLNAHLDDALNKLATVESVIRHQIKAIDESAGLIEGKSDDSVQKLTGERQQLIDLTETLNREADHFAEAIAEKAKLGMEKSDAANARIAGAEKELADRLASLEETSIQAIQAFENLATSLAEKEQAVVESAEKIDIIRSEASKKTEDLNLLMEENASAITNAQLRLEEESARLENLIKDQRERADRLANAIAEQTDRIGTLTIEPEEEVAAPEVIAEEKLAPTSFQPLTQEVGTFNFTSIETEEPKPQEVQAEEKQEIAEPLTPPVLPAQQVREQRQQKSWRDILTAADQQTELTAQPAQAPAQEKTAPQPEPEPTPEETQKKSADTDVLRLIKEMQQFTVELEAFLFGQPEDTLIQRFFEGERNIFANLLLHRDQRDLQNRIRLEAGRNPKFQTMVYDFLGKFDQLLGPATNEQDSESLLDDYLGSPIGRTYLVIGSAVDYFS